MDKLNLEHKRYPDAKAAIDPADKDTWLNAGWHIVQETKANTADNKKEIKS